LYKGFIESSDELPTITEPIKRINSFIELFDYFGYKVEEDLPDEISLKQCASEHILKVPKQIFAEF